MNGFLRSAQVAERSCHVRQLRFVGLDDWLRLGLEEALTRITRFRKGEKVRSPCEELVDD